MDDPDLVGLESGRDVNIGLWLVPWQEHFLFYRSRKSSRKKTSAINIDCETNFVVSSIMGVDDGISIPGSWKMLVPET